MTVGVGNGKVKAGVVLLHVVLGPLSIGVRAAVFEPGIAHDPFESRPVNSGLAVIVLVSRCGAFGGDVQAGEAVLAFGVRLAVGVAGADADVVANVAAGQGVTCPPVAPSMSLPSRSHWYLTSPMPSSSARVLPACRVCPACTRPLTVTVPVGAWFPPGGLLSARHFGGAAHRAFRVFAVVLILGLR